MTPRHTGWRTLAEDVRHPRTLLIGDVVYHEEHGRYSFLEWDANADNYQSHDMTAEDVAAAGLAGQEEIV